MKVKILVMLLLSSIIGLAACGAGASIEDTIWKLESYGEKGNLQTVIQDTEITIEFKSAEGEIAGSGGCNSYFGGYEINKNKLTIIPPIGSTMMACPEPIMDQEQEYFKLLETTETFQIQNGKLTISCSGNKILVFVAQ
jgi:heat shock protein HslJ